jgi:TRAP-type C4-dicarboxylate transport system permease large subunit
VLKLGFDPIWFGMLVAVTLMIGGIIPPVAMNVFITSNLTKIPLGVIYKGALPFLIALFVCGALLFLFPELALFLPKTFMR